LVTPEPTNVSRRHLDCATRGETWDGVLHNWGGHSRLALAHLEKKKKKKKKGRTSKSKYRGLPREKFDLTIYDLAVSPCSS